MLIVVIALGLHIRLSTEALHVQRRPDPLADSSAQQILAAVRSTGPNGLRDYRLAEILRQRDKPQSSDKLGEIADSLVADVVRQSMVSRATNGTEWMNGYLTLMDAGRVRGASPGRPYEGVLERMIRIFREAAPASMIRTLVVMDLLCYSDFRRGLAVLREAAVLPDRVAAYAMEELTTAAETGKACSLEDVASQKSQARAALRDLFDRDLARESQARQFLAGYAARQGWRRSP